MINPFLIIKSVLREKKKDELRSPHWAAARKKHLASNPYCVACGGKRLLQVHHIEPFHDHPELELDPNNLMTLCALKLCHLKLGHGGDFKYYNPFVVKDCAALTTARLRKYAGYSAVYSNLVKAAKADRVRLGVEKAKVLAFGSIYKNDTGPDQKEIERLTNGLKWISIGMVNRISQSKETGTPLTDYELARYCLEGFEITGHLSRDGFPIKKDGK
jgi:5-methylcytosine-specific restriction protein A